MKILFAMLVVCCYLAPASCSICGQLNDGTVQIPPNWDSFTPPAEGQSYVDPVFGCTVTRLTNAASDETSWDGKHLSFRNYYSTFTTINATDTMLFIASDDGNWRIKDMNGNVVIPFADMPAFNGHPIWDASNGSVFYYTVGNSLYSGTIAQTISGNSVTATVLHTFTEYSQGVISPDSADLSQDGDHIALVGQNPNNTMDVFVWTLNSQSKTSKYTTTCTMTGTIGAGGAIGCIHKLQLTADNRLTIEFADEGSSPEEGARLWNGSTLVHLQDATNHYDTGYDLNGNPVFIAKNNAATLAGITNPCASGTGIDARQIDNFQSSICLLDNQPPWHISYRGGVSQPWVAISFFDDRPVGPQQFSPELFSNDAHYQPPTSENWELYEDELVVTKIDASTAHRLAHARSRSNGIYWAQPHAAISRDGKYLSFTSNMAFANGCPANMHVSGDCSDVYVIQLQSNSGLTISPNSVVVNRGDSQTFAASGGTGPYTFSILTNNSGGSINATTGAYTAGCIGGVIDIIRVTDHAGNTSDATVTINAASNIGFVQSISPGFVTATSESATINETTGNLLVVAVYWNADSTTIRVADTKGNTYLSTPEINLPGGGWGSQVQIFYAQDIVSGANTVTVTQSTGAHAIGFYLLEYSGIRAARAFDVSTGQVAPLNTSAMSTGAMSTTGCTDLVVALFNDTSFASGQISAGAGFLSRGTDNGFISMAEDDVPGVGPGPINATATLPSSTQNWVATAAAFKAK
jgi:hypothetical protein